MDSISNWKDYWKIFETLCLSLSNRGKADIVDELKEAQKFVNGMTDGWFEFLSDFKKVVSKNREQLGVKERQYCDALINTLGQILTGK